LDRFITIALKHAVDYGARTSAVAAIGHHKNGEAEGTSEFGPEKTTRALRMLYAGYQAIRRVESLLNSMKRIRRPQCVVDVILVFASLQAKYFGVTKIRPF
jgi:hypothetical protein